MKRLLALFAAALLGLTQASAGTVLLLGGGKGKPAAAGGLTVSRTANPACAEPNFSGGTTPATFSTQTYSTGMVAVVYSLYKTSVGLSALTIGGASTTLVQSTNSGNRVSGVAYGAATGPNGNIVLSTVASNEVATVCIQVFSLGSSATFSASASTTDAYINPSYAPTAAAIPANGVGVAVITGQDPSKTSESWSGMTGQSHTVGVNVIEYAALSTAAGTTPSISLTGAGDQNMSFAMVTFGP